VQVFRIGWPPRWTPREALVPLEPQEKAKLEKPCKTWATKDQKTDVKWFKSSVKAAAKCGDAGRVAAVGLAVAVGNYEYLNGKRPAVLNAANELLDKYDDPEHSRRWG
jgi:hypothetical protein